MLDHNKSEHCQASFLVYFEFFLEEFYWVNSENDLCAFGKWEVGGGKGKGS